MRTDWQAYDAGSMGVEERRSAEELLRTDLRARKELEGLRSFQKAVRSAALKESVPLKRLEAALTGIVARQKLPAWRVRLVGVLAVACSLALAGIAYKNWPQPSAALEQTHEFSEFAQARVWAQEVSGVSIPPVGLGSEGALFSVHANKGWACFDYKVNNQYVHVRVSNVGEDLSCTPEDKLEDGVFVGDRSSNAHFDYAGLTVGIKSPRKALSVALAKKVMAACKSPTGAGPAQIAR